MTIYQEYIKSLKKVEVEETVDLFLFRPMAFALVKVLYRTPLTPNQISFIALVLGAGAGGFFAWGTKTGFFVGALLLVASHVFDCSDGMIARLKNNGTKIGRIVDGLADYLTFAFIYIGTAIGLSKIFEQRATEVPVDVWIIIGVVGVFHILHSIITDYYRNKFLFNVFGQSIDPEAQTREFEQELQKLKKTKGKNFEKAIIVAYLNYNKLQSFDSKKERKKYPSETYYKHNRVLLTLWNFIGNSSHVFVFALAAILFIPMIYVFYSLVVANILMLVLFILQYMANRRMNRAG